MRQGARLGVDVGSVRVGVALSDPAAMLATPVETVPRDQRGGTDVDRLVALAAEHEAVEIVVGLPLSLRGERGAAAELAAEFARALAQRIAPVPVRLVDERLSTVTAERGLRESGRRAKARRSVVDQAAAVIILQSALDTERLSGRPPGETMVVS